MACPVNDAKTKQLTLLDFPCDFHSKKLKLVEAEDDSESHSDLEVEDESLDEQDFSETERDSFLPTTSSRRQDNHITVQYPSASTTIIINDLSDHRTVAQDQQNFRVNPACTSESSTSQVPSDIAQGLHQQPAQPVIKFPTTEIGSKKRSFTSSWYAKYKWLEYSIIKDSAFCYPCRYFAQTSGRSSETFTKIGFCNWKHATGKDGILVRHDNCNTHKQAMCSWCDFVKNVKCGTSVAESLDSTRHQQILENRHYIKTLASVILFCGRQDIAL